MVKQSPDKRGGAGPWGLPSNENIMKAEGEIARVDVNEKQRFKQRRSECQVQSSYISKQPVYIFVFAFRVECNLYLGSFSLGGRSGRR